MNARWTTVVLPFFAEENDALGRAPGDVLWPERFGSDDVPSVERGEISSRSWNALYQQRPTAAEGNVFKREWFDNNRYDRLPDDSPKPDGWGQLVRPLPNLIAVGVDCASKTGVSNDFTCFVVALSDGTDYYIVAVIRERLEFGDLVRRTIEVHQKHHPSAFYIEDTSSGTPLIQSLQTNSRLVVLPMKPIGSKTARADAWTVYFESGRVKLPRSGPWVENFIEEFAAFPAGKHDDQIDATIWALQGLATMERRRQRLHIPGAINIENVGSTFVVGDWMAR